MKMPLFYYQINNSNSPSAPTSFATSESSTSCSTLADGILACRLARLPLLHTPLLCRLPFLAAGLLLGGALWWVTRRMYGNLGGYTALALYCFCPAVIQAVVTPAPEVLAALGLYAGVYTAIGVAHAMQGPCRKWRPRIVLLTAAFALAATSHIVALALAALLGLALMLWIAEGRRAQILPIVLLSSCGALLALFVCYGLSPSAFGSVFRSQSGFLSFSLDPARRFFFTLPHAGIALATAAALAFFLTLPRSRYFGNTTPLLCASVCIVLVTTGAPTLWALPFLLTFIAGLFADAYDSARPRLALAAGATLLALQAACSLFDLLRTI
ncbi:MAG: hypothetical protein P4K83_06340 [Terracidiphilus sp.]|nr:hypothetical protein [Terracidiphilus sp.]